MRISRSVAALAVLLATPLWATTTQYHVVSGFSDLVQGEPVSTALTSDGLVTLGPGLTKIVDSLAAQVLAIVPDGKKGAYIATGEPGRVIHVSVAGKTSTVFESKEPLVTALALASSGALYAATAPEGKVYKINPKAKTSTVYFSSPSKYTWALAADGKDLYAASGLEGAVYRIEREGVGAPFGAVKEKHVRSIAVGGRGSSRRVVAGGGAKGIVYVLQKGQGTRALFESPLDEITDIVVGDNGVIYAAAVSASERNGSEDSEDKADVADKGGAKESDIREVKSSEVYRIAVDGSVRLLWKSKKDGAYALALQGNSLLIGTGGRGRLYRVQLGGRFPISLLAKTGAAEITGLAPLGKAGVLVAGSAPGSLYLLGNGRRSQGEYLSKPLDAKRMAAYGVLRSVASAPAPCSIRFFIRQGNTEKIDETWGPFVEVRQGEAEQRPLVSRYVQVKAQLRGTSKTSPELASFELAYRLGNRSPRIKKVQTLAPGVRVEPMPDDEPKGRTFSVGSSSFDDFLFKPGQPVQPSEPKARARQTYERGWRTIVWKASDPDDDALLYDVVLKNLDDGVELTLGSKLDHAFVAFAADRLPDGRYRATVNASDQRDNSVTQTLTARLTGEPFMLDHTPPRLSRLRAKPVNGVLQIQFEAADASPLRGAWCSQDGRDWQAMVAQDGLTDEPNESYVGTIARNQQKRQRPIIVRCAIEDIVGNRSTSEIRIR